MFPMPLPSLHMLKRFALISILSLTALGGMAARPVAAQTGCTCPALKPAPVNPETIQKAFELLDKYKLPRTALDELVALINSPEKLTERLAKAGLSEDQISTMLKEARPLITEAGLDTGAIDRFVVEKARALLDQYGIPADKLDEFIAAQGDPAKVEAFLKDNLKNEDESQKFAASMTFYEQLGLDKQSHAYALAADALTLMGEYGVPPSALQALLDNVSNPQAMAQELSKYMSDPAKIQEALERAAPLIAEGLNAEVPATYIAQAAGDLLLRNGVPPEAYAEAFGLREDAKAFADYLQGLGVDPNMVDDLQSAFTDFTTVGLTEEALKAEADALESEADKLTETLEATDKQATDPDVTENGGAEATPTADAGNSSEATPEAEATATP